MQRRFTIFLVLLGFVLGAGTAWAGYEEGVQAFKSGNYSLAVSELQSYVQEAPGQWQGHYVLGQALLKLKRNQEALTSLRKAYDLNPNDGSVQLNLANAYLVNRRYRDAARLLRQIDEDSLPSRVRPVYDQMLAKALQESGQEGAALGPLRRAAASSPSDADAQYNYGAAALQAGQISAAVDALGNAARLEPSNSARVETYIQALFRLGRGQRGSAKMQTYRKALTAAQRLADANGSYDNLMLLGEAQLGAKEYAAAARTFRRASTRNSSDWLVYYYIGQAYTATGEYTNASSALQQALTKTSQSHDKTRIWSQLGFVYEKEKDYEKAKSAYRRAGDSGSVARVEKNEETAKYNQEVEQENKKIEEMKKEQERIEKELQQLPGGKKN
jgi:Flp pilus assembly protein TadD